MMNEISKKIGNLVGVLIIVIACAWTGLVVITFFITIFSSSVKEAGILYRWEAESKSEWKTFGDLEFHQKYVGEISDNKPDGDGILYYPDGKKLVGFWREGKLETWNENGKLYGRIYSYLIEFGTMEGMVWSIENDIDDYDMKYYEYEGEFKTLIKNKPRVFHDFINRLSTNFDQLIGSSDYLPKRKPHGFGTSTSKWEKYEGYWKNGKKHGEGTLTLKQGYSGIKEVGEWNDGKSHNTISYKKDGSTILMECELGLIKYHANSESTYDNSSCGLNVLYFKSFMIDSIFSE